MAKTAGSSPVAVDVFAAKLKSKFDREVLESPCGSQRIRSVCSASGEGSRKLLVREYYKILESE